MNLDNFKKLKNFQKIYLINKISKVDPLDNKNAYIIINDEILNKEVYFSKFKNKENVFLFSWQYFKRNYLTTLADYKSYKNIDGVYRKFKSKNKRLIKFFNFLYNSEHFEIALRKNIITKLKNYYEIKVIKRIVSLLTKKIIIDKINDAEFLDFNNFYEDKKKLFFEKKLVKQNFKKLIVNIFYPIYICFNNKLVIKKKSFY